MIFSRRSDLPIERDALGRFLPWIIAFMVYMAALALAGILLLNALADRWDQGVSGVLTVQIMPSKNQPDSEKIDAAIRFLMTRPGVMEAKPIDPARVLALLEPWLGSAGQAAGDLPLPLLIDLRLQPDARIDVKQLAGDLEAAIPGSSLDDHRIWLDRLLRLIDAARLLALVLLAAIGTASAGTVVFTTRTGLAIHQDVIEVLHLIGARDSYIAGQFASRALGLGLKGGLLGLALSVPTLLGLAALAARLEAGMLPEFQISVMHWALLAALPAAAAIIAMLTARFTVLGTLGRMP